jgi:hypothetical protein
MPSCITSLAVPLHLLSNHQSELKPTAYHVHDECKSYYELTPGVYTVVQSVHHCTPPCCCNRTYVQRAHMTKLITEPSGTIIA